MPKEKNPEQSMNFFLGGIKSSLENIEKTLANLCVQLAKLEERVDRTEQRVTIIETKFLVYAGIMGFAMWAIPLLLT
jgi:hypothetical protein